MAASILGILVIVCGVPVTVGILMTQPHLYRFMLGALAFTTCHIKKPFYQEVFFENYRGVDRGFGVTIPDVIFLGFAIHIAMGGTGKKINWLPYNTFVWLAICGVSLMSLVGQPAAYYGLFTIHKMFRCLILYWVMCNVIRDKKDVHAIVMGLTYAIVFQLYMVMFDRYVTKKHVNRSVGSFPHPNSLAMYVDLIIPWVFSLNLSNEFTKKQARWAHVSVVSGIACVILGKSRAALVIMLMALGSTMMLSIAWKPTLRKFAILATATFFAMIAGAAIAPMVIKRFTEAPEASHQTRIYFNQAAEKMANDLTFGVGINAYSWALANTGYYWDVYPDKIDTVRDPIAFRESKNGKSRLGTAHHIYYLWAGEIGWGGMWLFVLFQARFVWKNFLYLLTTKDVYMKSLYLGMFLGFATLHLQGFLEWILRQTQVMYLYFMLCGLMIGTKAMLKREGLK